jgi:hypothetical protein
MNLKKWAGLLFGGFCLFLFSTSLSLAQSGSIAGDVTDSQWLKFMANKAFNLKGLHYKMPLLAGELNLKPGELQEVKNLFSDHGDEKLLSQMAASPGIKGKPQDRSLSDSQRKTKNEDFNEMEDSAAAAPAKTLDQVKLVRTMLGLRDMDFRFWFFEEGLIDGAEDRAYHQDPHYSPDQLTQSIIQSIEETQEFKDFKSRKMAWLHSVEKVDGYLAAWRTWLGKRVLLQVQQR